MDEMAVPKRVLKGKLDAKRSIGRPLALSRKGFSDSSSTRAKPITFKNFGVSHVILNNKAVRNSNALEYYDM
jgi:hypothetical protein